MRQVSEKGAQEMERANGEVKHQPLGRSFEEIAEECKIVHDAKRFAQSLQVSLFKIVILISMVDFL